MSISSAPERTNCYKKKLFTALTKYKKKPKKKNWKQTKDSATDLIMEEK